MCYVTIFKTLEALRLNMVTFHSVVPQSQRTVLG